MSPKRFCNWHGIVTCQSLIILSSGILLLIYFLLGQNSLWQSPHEWLFPCSYYPTVSLQYRQLNPWWWVTKTHRTSGATGGPISKLSVSAKPFPALSLSLPLWPVTVGWAFIIWVVERSPEPFLVDRVLMQDRGSLGHGFWNTLWPILFLS